MRTFEITPADEGRSPYSLLRNAMPSAPRALLRKLARDSTLTVNSDIPKESYQLRVGDVVALRESARVLELLALGPCPLDILHDDVDLLVLNKPAGLAVHPTEDSTGNDLLSRAAGLAPRLGHCAAYHVVNRLDRWTSGAVLLTPGTRRTAAFAGMFERREVDKRYVALVAGAPPYQGTMDDPVDGHPARTTFEVLSQGHNAALVLAHPETGRKHQVRRHFAALGHPLVGDQRYRGPATRKTGGALLHAVAITFKHPATGEVLSIVAPLPDPFRCAMDAAGLAPTAIDAMFEALSRLGCRP